MEKPANIKSANTGAAILSRGILFTVIWWILTNGVNTSWWIGIPTVLISVMVSIALLKPSHFIWYELLKFIPFFIVRSIIGGTDVAWRAIHPRMPIAPELIEYSVQLPAGLPRVFMASTINLLPGTLSAAIEKNIMRVHILDKQQNFIAEIQAVEQSMARIFDIPLTPPLRGK